MMSLASHEFRTPTAMIQASLDSLQYLKDAISPEVQKRLDNIRKGCELLERIANRLIEFERLHELALHPKRQSIQLGPVLRQVANSYSAEQPLQGDWPSQPIIVDADPLLLGVALHNLIDNALRHHIPANGMVTLSAGQEGNVIIIRVTDNPAGGAVFALEIPEK